MSEPSVKLVLDGRAISEAIYPAVKCFFKVGRRPMTDDELDKLGEAVERRRWDRYKAAEDEARAALSAYRDAWLAYNAAATELTARREAAGLKTPSPFEKAVV